MENICKLTSEEENLLLEQIKFLHSELCSIQSSFLGVISIPVAVYGLLIYYALHSDTSDHPFNLLFILMPFLFSLSVFNILKYTIKMMGLDAYIRYLEGQLNSSHGKTLFKWQSYLIYANSYSVVGGIIQIPSFFALAIFLGYEFIKNIRLCNIFPHCKFVFVSLLACQIIGLLYMLFICLTHYGAVGFWCDTIAMCPIPSENFHSECPLFFRSFYEKTSNWGWFKKAIHLIDKIFHLGQNK